MADPKHCIRVVTDMAYAFGHDMPKEAIRVYVRRLAAQPMTDEELQAATDRLIDTHTGGMPTVAQIIAAVEANRAALPDAFPTANEAWEWCQKSISGFTQAEPGDSCPRDAELGRYAPARRALEAIGGWPMLWNLQASDEHWRRRDFAKVYDGLLEAERSRDVAAIVGAPGVPAIDGGFDQLANETAGRLTGEAS